MTRLLIGLAAFVALGAGVAAPAEAVVARVDAATADSVVVVAGSGTFVDGTVTVTVFVVGSANGSALGYVRTTDDAGRGSLIRVDCLRVEGSRALAGGTILSSSAPPAIGLRAAFVLDDIGSMLGPARDRIIIGVENPDLPEQDPCDISPSRIAGPFDVLTSGDFYIARP